MNYSKSATLDVVAPAHDVATLPQVLPPLTAIAYNDPSAAQFAADEIEDRDLPRSVVQLVLTGAVKPFLVVSFAHEDITATEVLKALSAHATLEKNYNARFADYDSYFRSELGERLADRVAAISDGLVVDGTLCAEEVDKLLEVEHAYDQQVVAHSQGGLDRD